MCSDTCRIGKFEHISMPLFLKTNHTPPGNFYGGTSSQFLWLGMAVLSLFSGMVLIGLKSNSPYHSNVEAGVINYNNWWRFHHQVACIKMEHKFTPDMISWVRLGTFLVNH
jgi:hypothetical protein